MILNSEFRAHLHSIAPQFNGVNVGYYSGPNIEVEDSELHVIVTGLAGLGFDAEGVLDIPGYQLRTIGKSGNLEDAERFAVELDQAVLAGPFPMDVAGKRVVMIGRTGGAPAPLPLDETNRSNWVCSYLITQGV